VNADAGATVASDSIKRPARQIAAMTEPRVSIIIPNHNRASLIGETIQNMMCQSLTTHKIIISDHGSTDNSCYVVRRFGDRVALMKQSTGAA
jgi:cellulose synthase/poly-beta-1,6-N-acetylglucosamine synthase-like glycosyltransferase